jgi:4-amino-4-deoxy-L-arabinose transferase-like glycosyltransferase
MKARAKIVAEIVMQRRWYVGVISISVALNALLFGWLVRSLSRAAQPAADQSPSPAASPPQPDRPVANPIVPSPPPSMPPTVTPPATITASRRWPASNTMTRVVLGSLLVAAILLAVLAQSLFSVEHQEDRDAGIPYALAAMLLFSLAAFGADRWLGRADDPTDCPTAPHKSSALSRASWLDAARSTIRTHPRRTLVFGISGMLIVSVLMALQIEPALPNYALVFAMWIIALGIYLGAAASAQPMNLTIAKRDWRRYRPVMAAVLVIGLLALLVRVINLDGIPLTISGDEGGQGAEALKILRGELRNPFVTSWLSVPTLSFFFNALSIGLLGDTMFALRLPWALVGTAAVIMMFLLTRRLKTFTLALIVGLLLATYHYHIHFSRLGSNQIADTLLMASALFFLYRAYDRGLYSDWALAGVTAGLAQYFYAGARLVTLVVLVSVIVFLIREGWRFWYAQRAGIIILIGAFLITAAPMLQYAVQYPRRYQGRVRQVGILQNGWLDQAQRASGHTAAEILLDQFKRTTLAYNATTDQSAWYGSTRPFLDGLPAVLFILGLGYATLRPLDRRLFPLLLWWWAGIILGGVMTDNSPSSQRLIITAPVAIFFVALALWKSGQILQRLWPGRLIRSSNWVLGGALVAVVSIASLAQYFIDYTPQYRYGNPSAIRATELARFAHDNLDDRWQLVMVGAPYLYSNFGALQYLLPTMPRSDLIEPLTEALNPARYLPDQNLAFVFLEPRYGEFYYVRRAFPDGYLDTIAMPNNPEEVAFYVYRVVR